MKRTTSDPPTGFLNRTVRLEGNDYRYQVYVPMEYDPKTAWPVVLSLHGSGERGSDGLVQTEVGIGRAVRRHVQRFPALVVFPQSPRGDRAGWQGLGARLALATLDQTVAEFTTDPTRIYLTGLSMGGNGCWYLAYHHAERFAAMAVVCGFVSARWSKAIQAEYPPIADSSAADPFEAVAARVRSLPIWIFHGDADTVVPVEESRGMANALQRLRADVRYTEFPGVGHNAWDEAYERADFAEWLFAQRRPIGGRP